VDSSGKARKKQQHSYALPVDKQQQDHYCFVLQNVRGDGDCVFLAIMQQSGVNNNNNDDTVDTVRRMVANVFQAGTEMLRISPDKVVSASALLQRAAQEMNCSKSVYLQLLRTPGRYGGLYGGMSLLLWCVELNNNR
jgi:hypothetical protein